APREPGADPTAPQRDGTIAGETVTGGAVTGDAGTDGDFDAVWAEIVADYDAPSKDPVPPWPVAEDLGDSAPRDSGTGTVSTGAAGATTEPARRPTDWRTDPDKPDLVDSLDTGLDEGGYEPPPPPPIPRPSRYTALAIGSIALGLVLCIRPDLLGIAGIGEDGGLAVGFILLLAGVVTLVLRLRPGTEEEDDDPDDGAVV
ncbi:MAG: hypothetical protein WCA46_01830, partial [Actinocatenispora sp.]